MFEVASFNWEELNGKTLKIIVSKDESKKDITSVCIFGHDQIENKIYLLHNEIR